MAMSPQEKVMWEKSRKSGGFKYVVKSSLTSYLMVFLIYFIGNGIYHIDDFATYARKNLVENLDYTLMVSFITIVALMIVSSILWVVNEKRYKSE